MSKLEVKLIGGIGEKKSNSGTQYYNQNRIYDPQGLSTAIPTSFQPNYEIKRGGVMKIRKLTPKECLKLQGFSEEDYLAISQEFGDLDMYHVAGDSISTTVLMSIFGECTEINYCQAIDNYVETLKGDYTNEK